MSKDKSPSDSGRPYMGPERRKRERRKKNRDQRDKLRFEPEKNPRRSGIDRRKQPRDIWRDHDD